MSRWFRHYAGMMRDEKLVRVAVKAKQPIERVVWVWGAILESASEINDEGRYDFDTGEAAYFLRCDENELVCIVQCLDDLGRLSGGVVVRWGERQFNSDSAKERQRRYRERRKTGSDIPELHDDMVEASQTVTRDVTPPSRDGQVTLQEYRDRDREETTPSGVVSGAAPPNDLDDLQSKLIEAVGDGNIQPHGALDLSSMIGLIVAGVDLETDILPTIRAKAQRLRRPAGSWAYFVDAIRDAHARRIEAGRGVVKPPTIEAGERRWQTRLDMARRERSWSTAEWGPMPGLAGCLAPAHMLQPGDGDGWKEWERDAA